MKMNSNIVEIYPGFSLVERFIVLLRQLSYAIKNQRKARNTPQCLELVLYGIRELA